MPRLSSAAGVRFRTLGRRRQPRADCCRTQGSRRVSATDIRCRISAVSAAQKGLPIPRHPKSLILNLIFGVSVKYFRKNTDGGRRPPSDKRQVPVFKGFFRLGVKKKIDTAFCVLTSSTTYASYRRGSWGTDKCLTQKRRVPVTAKMIDQPSLLPCL